MSFRNRCIIAGANGPVPVSVPLAGGRDQKTLMKDIRVSEREDWQKQHWKTILSCYNCSPWFEFYKDELGDLYHRPFHFLQDWNLACMEWIESKLPLGIPFSLTNQYIKSYEPGAWQDDRNVYLPKNYMDYNPIGYHQVFEERTGFLPNLSILDLLFCEGPRAVELIRPKS